MPSVNAGPSNSATANTQTPLVNIQGANPTSAGLVISQSATAVGTQVAPLLIAQTAVAAGIANTGTMGANGALTLGTALASATAYTAGIYLYFPAGAVFTSSAAGFYFTKMSSTTAGVVYSNTLSLSVASIPTALVPVVDAGPGAYTGATTAQTAAQLTVPANVMGPNGFLQFEAYYSYNNSAGIKNPGGSWGGITLLTGNLSTTASLYLLRTINNRGVTNLQMMGSGNVGLTVGGGSTLSPTLFTVDTTQSSTFALTLTIATATDFIILDYFRLTAVYSA